MDLTLEGGMGQQTHASNLRHCLSSRCLQCNLIYLRRQDYLYKTQQSIFLPKQ
ncbi:hypothetical protein PL8927_730027 [Planktothrix serta PCC 8927]|uniref:Uncharacterized protein n=1 Tax=Planktothrix serta PCC 8927 TaxID=671068 RepID=A0A7Z9BSY3_9CYAN|nr:hypothetical protein PL8927_730027 [Planktothrix serta PCC 8927]